MSSPENAAAESGEDQKGKDSDMKNPHVSLPVSPHDDLPSSSHEDLLYSSCHDHLHLSSQETTPRLVNYKALKVKNLPAVFHSGNELHNRDKNRYRDILPYDSTRVPLGENKDYINASYIKIANSGAEYYYIATQGPLPTTMDDFWQMVLENNSNVIAMITKEKEGGVTKCHHYWPISMQKPLELNSCCIFLENYQILRYFIIRMFQVVKKSFDIMNIVGQMREQRHGMIQTKEQYMFCYKIVLEVLQKLWTVNVPLNHLFPLLPHLCRDI